MRVGISSASRMYTNIGWLGVRLVSQDPLGEAVHIYYVQFHNLDQSKKCLEECQA